MSYKPLPPVVKVSGADTTGQNPGNWTTQFAVQDLPRVAVFEIWHMIVSDTPVAATASILIHNKQFSTVTTGLNGNEWDPSTPALVSNGDEINFLWQVATSVTPAPQVTLWLRYDPELSGNTYPGL